MPRPNPKVSLLLCAAAATALWCAPTAFADDPASAPTVDKSEYTTPDDPGWVFFRARGGEGCGISPDGVVGCDIVVALNDDGTVVQWGRPGPPGSYSCNLPETSYVCPLPPPGTNEVIAGPQDPAHYASSDTPRFTRNAKALPEGYRLVNGDAWCYVSGASPGGVTCRTGANGFHWSSAGGILGVSLSVVPPTVTRNATIYLGLVIAALLTVAPFALGLLTSFTSAQQFATGTPLSLPRPPTLENYTALGSAGFGRAIAVTALMTAVITLGQLTFSVLAAYAFARLDFPGRDAVFWVYLATLMVPATVTVVPLYLMMAELGLRNTFWALVLPFLFGSPYAIFLLREYFRSIPKDLLSAARIDGANTLDVIVHVVVPASKPILATLTLITVVSQWNSFMWPLVITSGGKWRVLTVATAGLQSQYNAQWTLVMAATTVAIVPLVILFAMFQRHIVRSIVVTGLK